MISILAILISSDPLSQDYEKRYVVIDKDTRKILDKAQGYGYKTEQEALAAWEYKTRDKSQDKRKT